MSHYNWECSKSISVMDLYCGKLFQNYWVSCGWCGWGSIVESFFSDHSDPFFSGAVSTFIHLSLGKAGPFTLDSHIHAVKPWKSKVSQTIFQGGTPWVTQILNNGIVSMAPYCAQKKIGPMFFYLKGKSMESRLMSIELLTFISWLS